MGRRIDSRRAAGIGVKAIAWMLLASLAAAGTASAGNATATGGGAAAPGVPTIRSVICASGCVGLYKATVGGTVQVSGAHLGAVTQVVFPGAHGRPVASAATDAGERVVFARVPPGAASGRVRVRDGYGNASARSASRLRILPAGVLRPSGPLALVEARAAPRRSYYFGTRFPRLRFVISSQEAQNDLRVDVVDSSGAVVRSFFRDGIAPNTTNTVRWNGVTSEGRPAPNGRYSFRVSSQSGIRAARPAARNTAIGLGFTLYGYEFPIRGAHQYGSSAGRFGAGRSGHTHQGQDVMAACGTPLVAARGGRVRYSGWDDAAGTYLVIDGKGTGFDTVYMHMMRPSPLKAGQVVRTGKKIGVVGETGDATGCHLHFELWTAPGWYEGGHPVDPLPYLRKWDRYS